MQDKDGKPLRAGDKVRVEYETTVVGNDGSSPVFSCWLRQDCVPIQEPMISALYGIHRSVLTKIEPEFEWTSSKNLSRNTVWHCDRRHSNGMTYKVGDIVHILEDDMPVWRIVMHGDAPGTQNWPTLEAAKAAAERAAKEGT